MAAVDRGVPRARVAVDFGVSLASVGRYLARRARAGTPGPTVQRHGPLPVEVDALAVWLPDRLDAAAGATLPPPALGGQDLTPSGRRRRPGRPLKQRR